MVCPICNGPSERWREIEGIPILRCHAADCGFRFFDLAFWHGDEQDYYKHWEARRPTHDRPWIQARIAIVRKFKAGGIAAELGCGLGETAIALDRAGFSVSAVDDSERAIRYLRNEFPQIDWHHEGVMGFAAKHPASFDVVTMFHVLEHVPRPKRLIELVGQALRPDGIVIIEVPDVSGGLARLKGLDWDYFHTAHVNYFDARSLQKLMSEFGFKRQFFQRVYHFSYPQGNLLKDIVKGWLATIGVNAIIRTAWAK